MLNVKDEHECHHDRYASSLCPNCNGTFCYDCCGHVDNPNNDQKIWDSLICPHCGFGNINLEIR